uniref:Cytochrome c oxidase assembly factor 1 n=1 Tax=Sus scrofa TaxID=9823 RepID=A0A8D1I4B4_PIG
MQATLGRALLPGLQNRPWCPQGVAASLVCLPHGAPSRQRPLLESEANHKFVSSVFQSPGSRMSVPLGKLVFFSSVATSGTCTLLYFLIQKMFSRASYYQLALEHLHSHAEALEALGTPLSVHYLQLTDKYNFEDIADAQLRIPVSGPKSEGHLYVSSSREGPFRRWNLQEVFLELRDGHRIPVFKPSGEGPASLPVVLAASVRRVSKRKRFPKVSIRLPREKGLPPVALP